jgi:hypothetical protein
MAISTTFKYLRKALDNNCDAWITCYKRVRGLMMVGLTLLKSMIACSGNCASSFTINPFVAFAIQHKTKYDKGKKNLKRLSKYMVL